MIVKKIFKWLGIGVGSLVALICLSLGVVYFLSQRHFDEKLTIAGHPPTVPSDTATVARGRQVINSYGMCADCHGPDLGGQVFIDVPIFAQLYAANLTSGEGGIGGTLTDLDWERAIRHGVKPDGGKLLFMPSHEYTNVNDADVIALIAYLKQIPKVDRPVRANHIGPIGRLLYLKGDLPLLPAELMNHTAAHPAEIQPAPTAEYGRYIANTCAGCHGPTFSGGAIPGTPLEFRPPANITPTGIGHYTEADFFAALRTGMRPKGVPIDTVYMPVRFTKNLTDEQITAVYAFLKTVPPKEYGGR